MCIRDSTVTDAILHAVEITLPVVPETNSLFHCVVLLRYEIKMLSVSISQLFVINIFVLLILLATSQMYTELNHRTSISLWNMEVKITETESLITSG